MKGLLWSTGRGGSEAEQRQPRGSLGFNEAISCLSKCPFPSGPGFGSFKNSCPQWGPTPGGVRKSASQGGCGDRLRGGWGQRWGSLGVCHASALFLLVGAPIVQDE